MEYIMHLAIFICFYTMLAQSLNLVAGFTGLISLTHAGFYGIGAYVTAILSKNYDSSFWINLPLAMMISGIVAFIISFIILRTIAEYFVICTLSLQVIIFSLMNNWLGLTNGPFGITEIPAIDLAGFTINSNISFFFLSLLFLSLIWGLLKNISASAFGMTLRAIQEDEIYVQSIGKNVSRSKVISFTLGAVLAAIPGSIYAHYMSYIDPGSFTVNESIFILSIVIIGGLGYLKGSFWTAVFLVLLPEVLRFLHIESTIAANMRQIIYGLILILTVTFKIDASFFCKLFNKTTGE